MEVLSSTAKGDLFEDEVFEFFKDYVLSGEYSVNPDKCKFYQKKGYYSHKRKSDIKVDISIEVHAQKKENLSLLLVVECKNYGHPVGVEDIEEFDSKLLQISGRNVKGIVFTKVGFRKGALEYALSTGIGLARLLPEEQIDWVLERTPKAVNLKDRANSATKEVINALTDERYRGQSEAIFSAYDGVFSSSFSQILDRLIPSEYKENIDLKKQAKVEHNYNSYIPFLGQEDIEKRTSRVLDYFKSEIRQNQQIILAPIYDYLTENKGVEFVFNEDLGQNSRGNDTLGKFNLNPQIIYISNKLEKDSPRWRFTLAHEIGHYLMHRTLYQGRPETNQSETNDTLRWDNLNKGPLCRLEWQANSFASSLLLPRDLLVPILVETLRECGVTKYCHGVIYLDEQRDNIHTYQKILYRLNREFNVSYQAINYRLAQLKLLNNQLKQNNIRDIANRIPILR